jgi:hypothetical protein
MKDRNSVQPPYYICEDYSVLAGPYDVNYPLQQQMLDNVVNDMKRGNIDYRLTSKFVEVTNSRGEVTKVKRVMVERRGMILYKVD